MSSFTTERILRSYAWLFLAAGLLFVLDGKLAISILDAGAFLPGARPLPSSEPGLWLALTGSMMAMISYLSFEAARDPGQEAAWNALLLSKGVSTALFVVFAAAQRNVLFLAAAAVDGAIFLHLRILRRAAAVPPRSLFASRLPAGEGPFYEVWFAKLNDPATRNALWLRYTVSRAAAGAAASCWYVLFDKGAGRVLSGRWSRPLARWRRSQASPFEMEGGSLQPGRLAGSSDAASWEFSWSEPAAPPFGFVPPSLSLTGLAGSDYVTPVSLALFDGVFRAEGRDYVFKDAPGCVGHIWGRRMADNWRWAHAVFESRDGGPRSVFEILSAQVRLGPLLLPRLTCAHLWHGGRHHVSVGLWRGLRNVSRREGDRWLFRVGFGELAAEGECAPQPRLTAELDYQSPEGRRLRCRNSKTGSMVLRLRARGASGAAVLRLPDTAAVEFVEAAA